MSLLKIFYSNIAIWDSLERLNFFGSGNSVADPYKEIIVLLIQYSNELCNGNNWLDLLRRADTYRDGDSSSSGRSLMSRGEAISRAISSLDKIWRTSIDEIIHICSRKTTDLPSGYKVEGQFSNDPENSVNFVDNSVNLQHNVPDYVFASYLALLSLPTECGSDPAREVNFMDKYTAFHSGVECFLPPKYQSPSQQQAQGNGNMQNIYYDFGSVNQRSSSISISSSSNSNNNDNANEDSEGHSLNYKTKTHKKIVFRRMKKKSSFGKLSTFGQG